MSHKKTVASAAASFLIVFAVGSLLADRRKGLKYGVAVGVVAAVGGLVLASLGDDSSDLEAVEELTDDVAVTGSESDD